MLWKQCLSRLKSNIPESDLNTWLLPLQAREITKEHGKQELCLLAPNQLVVQKINSEYIDLITDNIRFLSGQNDHQVNVQVGSTTQVQPEQNVTLNQPSNGNYHQPNIVPGQTQAPLAKKFTNSLSTKMTFDNFVEGKSNQLARAAAIQVSENPGSTYNPFFIYGGVGLGKTHLMHAIGNRIRELNHNAKVIYLHSEHFVNDMVTALRNNRIDDFKQYYRSADALLIDDVQFFAGKGRSMEEFFHTFNTLLECQKQIVLASDRFPREVDVDPRLRTRLNWGLTLSIEPPDLETRVAILRKKCDEICLDLPNDISFFIAERFKSNIRDLEGALNRVLASVHLHNQTNITLPFVREALRDQLASQYKMVSIENIKKTASDYFNIRVSEMDTKKRNRSIARPRQIAMALSKELTNHSLPEIGKEFGGRDHTTVLHACRKVEELRQIDPKIEEDWKILMRTLTT